MVRARKQLGKRIQKLRKEKGFTQEEFAEKLDISRTHMGHVEQGIRSPSLELMEKISKSLKIKMGDLF